MRRELAEILDRKLRDPRLATMFELEQPPHGAQP
jgi:ribosome-binding factor A